MENNISHRRRATAVGILILLAYSMLTYSLTNNRILGIITDLVSGIAVIAIPLLMFPILDSTKNKALNYAYLLSRFIEGVLMIIGGIFILIPSLEPFRESIYNDIHIYFFISGALFLYILLYRTQVVPKFISVFGIIATVILLSVTIIKLFGLESQVFQILLLPTILTELFLAFWFIIKGFNVKTIDKQLQGG